MPQRLIADVITAPSWAESPSKVRFVRDEVEFVEHQHSWGFAQSQVCKHGIDDFGLFSGERIGDVSNVNQQVCEHRLFECGVECVDQDGRKLIDETNGVAERRLACRTAGTSLRVVVSKVSNGRSTERMSEPVNALNSADLPAFV